MPADCAGHPLQLSGRHNPRVTLNSEALAERQANGAACHVCDESLDDSAPVVAVLSGKPGTPLFLHAGCCPAYTARRVSLVDRIMASAGYGETLTNGKAA